MATRAFEQQEAIGGECERERWHEGMGTMIARSCSIGSDMSPKQARSNRRRRLGQEVSGEAIFEI